MFRKIKENRIWKRRWHILTNIGMVAILLSSFTDSAFAADVIPKKKFCVMLVDVINVALAIIGAVCVAFIIYAGILFMIDTSDEKRKKAKDTIRNAIIGLVIALLSVGIVNFVIVNVLGGNPGDPCSVT